MKTRHWIVILSLAASAMSACGTLPVDATEAPTASSTPSPTTTIEPTPSLTPMVGGAQLILMRYSPGEITDTPEDSESKLTFFTIDPNTGTEHLLASFDGFFYETANTIFEPMGFTLSPDGRMVLVESHVVERISQDSFRLIDSPTFALDLDESSLIDLKFESPDGWKLWSGGYVWSADSRSIAFMSDLNSFSIFIWDVEVNSFAELPQSIDFSHSDWSPDGARFALLVDNRSIWIGHADGKPAAPIAADPVEGTRTGLAWSPDSQKIAYFSTEIELNLNSCGYADRPCAMGLFVIDPATGVHQLLASNPFQRYSWVSPRWSPDGEWIAYFSHANDPEVDTCDSFTCIADVFIVSSDGSETRPLTSHTNNSAADYTFRYANLAWAPDSQSLAYIYSTYDPETNTLVSAVRIIDINSEILFEKTYQDNDQVLGAYKVLGFHMP